MRLLLLLSLGLFRLRSLSAQTDAGNFDPGQLPPMSDRAMIPLPAAVFERDELLVLALLDHLAGHRGALDQGPSVGDLVPIAVKKDVAKNGFLARISFEEIDIDNIALRDTVLSAACFNNCVSHTKSRLPGGKAAQTPTGAPL